MLQTNVLIVGGGPAGLTLAALLGGAGIEVTVVDRDSRERQLGATFDGRTTAISQGSRRVLEAAGVWPALAGHGAPILDIRIADDRAPLFLHFDHAEVGTAPFGHIFENRDLRAALFARLDVLPTVRHLAPVAVRGLRFGAARAEADLEGDSPGITAELVVGADGRGSPVRRWAGIGCRQFSYDQDALVCTIAHERPHRGLAVEHFFPPGPFAVLPMTDGPDGRHRSSIVWTDRPGRADRFMALDEAGFDAALQHRVGTHLGQVRCCSRRFRHGLGLSHAARYTGHRVALIGDAAHGIHPIAGQGLNLSMRDIGLLARMLIDGAGLGLDPGQPARLRGYEARRRPDNLAMILATDVLDRLFSTGLPPVRVARRIGLSMVDRLPPLKRFFMREAMGREAVGGQVVGGGGGGPATRG